MARGDARASTSAPPRASARPSRCSNEGRRRRERGTDVVVGFVETHGRPQTAEQIGDLEVVPRQAIEYRGTTFEEMDVDAVLARAAARSRSSTSSRTRTSRARGNEKRWQDVEELLEAGIDVISTLNIQHLESLNDVVEQITGIKQRETIPDEVVRRADQIELVDMTPEALRRRMAHGNIYPPERIDAALANYFRPGNLAALRELALLWLADRVDEGLADYRERHGITEPWETRERVVVALTGSPDGDRLDPPRRPDGRTRASGELRRRARAPAATASPAPPAELLDRAARARRASSAARTTRSSARTSARRCSTFARAAERHAARARAQPPLALAAS